MAKTATTDARPEAKANGKDAEQSKAKRKMLTPAERVAKLEAELAAARAKTQEKDRKAHADVVEKISKLQAKRDEIDTKLSELGAERDAIVARVPELVNEQQPTEA